jgi:hypothetical protein
VSLTPCRYGHALIRFIHAIICLRLLRPYHLILLTKVDLKSAYRWLHYTAAMAVQACVLVCNLLLVALRLTFGGAANPCQWSNVSELAFNLANDLIWNPGWDPSLHIPHTNTSWGTNWRCILQTFPLPLCMMFACHSPTMTNQKVMATLTTASWHSSSMIVPKVPPFSLL